MGFNFGNYIVNRFIEILIKFHFAKPQFQSICFGYNMNGIKTLYRFIWAIFKVNFTNCWNCIVSFL